MTTETTVPLKHDPYAALRFRDFRLLIGGRFVAQVGEMTVSVGIGWELYERTRDPFALGLVGLVQVLPVMLLSLPGGYIADRYNRRLVTLLSQLVLVACSLVLAYLSITDGALPWIYLCLAVIGAARAFNNPAEGALTPETVPEEHYFNAATWSSSVWQFSAITGPAIGGLLIALAGSATPVYIFNALAGLVLVSVLLLLRTKAKNYALPEETPLQSLRAGLRFLQSTPVILASITLDMFAVLLGGAVFLLPVYASDILQVDAVGLGILRAAPSMGALVMALYLARRPPFQRAGVTLLWAVAGFGVATIFFGLSTSFWLSVLMLALTGALDNISVVIRHTLILTHTPNAMRGRVGAVNSVFIGASNELGGFESGVAAALLGPVGAVVLGGVGTILVVGGVAWWSPELRRLGAMQPPETGETG
ncbi:MAG: MFS transporter [Anaerolineae bacterium]|nr:MFS transporter [Anaerolineae bacterium]